MKYKNIKKGKFISRPNRFISNIEINGKIETVHVKNTGRCKELLTDNATVFVQEINSCKRKTKYDLISVYKKNKLINIDSQAPNKIFREWIVKSNIFSNIENVKAEVKYGNSRFDFYLEADNKKIFVEVKGVTLEHDDIALFPDAPTLRGLKHINELCKCTEDGYEAYVVFIIQMRNIKYFMPNYLTHNEFGEALKKASKMGVNIIALDCEVRSDLIEIKDFVDIKL